MISTSRIKREGLLLVDKPPGATSHDVVQIIRRKLGMRQIGHTGTLDPMATGLLMILVGSATKHQRAFQTHDKWYEAVLRMGTQTDTADATGTPIRSASIPALDRASVDEALASFRGPLRQTPPAYSAVKVKGRPAYWWARQNRTVRLGERTVQIFDINLVRFDAETVTFQVHCSAGTYIRSLAESIAERLGTVGHLAGLVRLQIGEWGLEKARPFSWLTEASSEALARELLTVPIKQQASSTQYPCAS